MTLMEPDDPVINPVSVCNFASYSCSSPGISQPHCDWQFPICYAMTWHSIKKSHVLHVQVSNCLPHPLLFRLLPGRTVFRRPQIGSGLRFRCLLLLLTFLYLLFRVFNLDTRYSFLNTRSLHGVARSPFQRTASRRSTCREDWLRGWEVGPQIK